MADDGLITSALRRLVTLGGLAGRVGASVLGSQLAGLARSDDSRDAHRSKNLILNATRVVETLGQLKGAAMKVGQMLSLHEGLLPPEVSEVLRALQKEAPRVPEEVMEFEIRGALDNFDELFEWLDLKAHAAASIGQVHRGKLRDGRDVAVKIQYPLIDEIVKADLKNLRTVLKSLFALFSEVDFEPVWQEVRDRLLEELDYTHEASSMRRMADLHTEIDDVIIPAVVDEATTRNILTMEYVAGIPPAEACSEETPSELRNRWGTVLFEFMLRGLLEHRLLHADPNLANFAFLDDGRVIVYDFGCVKPVPVWLATGYARTLLAAIEGRFADIPQVLHDMGVYVEGGDPIPVELTDGYAEVFAPVFRDTPPYTFGEDQDLYGKLISLGLGNWSKAAEIQFPEDIVFVDRALAGHLGNLIRLGATGPWRDLAQRYAVDAAQGEST